jgi:hypothetical protein
MSNKMNAKLWLPLAVFLGVSIPLVLLLNLFNVAGEYRLWIALGAGALATALVQTRLQNKAPSTDDSTPQNKAGGTR